MKYIAVPKVNIKSRTKSIVVNFQEHFSRQHRRTESLFILLMEKKKEKYKKFFFK